MAYTALVLGACLTITALVRLARRAGPNLRPGHPPCDAGQPFCRCRGQADRVSC